MQRSLVGSEMCIRDRYLPMEDVVTTQVIALCHQGDLYHRSAKQTVKEFQRHFRLYMLTRTAEEQHIKTKCSKCLGCIKTRSGQSVPRPLWYMVYATTPFEYLHMDFVELPTTADGIAQLLVVVDDCSLATLLQPTNSANAATVAKALIDHWISCLLYTSPSPRDYAASRMPSSA